MLSSHTSRIIATAISDAIQRHYGTPDPPKKPRVQGLRNIDQILEAIAKHKHPGANFARLIPFFKADIDTTDASLSRSLNISQGRVWQIRQVLNIPGSGKRGKQRQ